MSQSGATKQLHASGNQPLRHPILERDARHVLKDLDNSGGRQVGIETDADRLRPRRVHQTCDPLKQRQVVKTDQRVMDLFEYQEGIRAHEQAPFRCGVEVAKGSRLSGNPQGYLYRMSTPRQRISLTRPAPRLEDVRGVRRTAGGASDGASRISPAPSESKAR